MLIAYISSDEVNRDMASRMAAARETTLHSFFPECKPPDSRFGAVLYDLDSMPTWLRRRVVAELLTTTPSRPMAVHTYKLDGETVALRGKGVTVNRRLGPHVIRALCPPSDRDPAPLPSVEDRSGMFDPNLVGVITVSAIGVASSN
jgi:hypothetical protein